MIEIVNGALERLWLGQFVLVPLAFFAWIAIRVFPLRPSTRALAALILLLILGVPAFLPSIDHPGETLAWVRSQFARTDVGAAGVEARGPWPWSPFETVWLAGALLLLLRWGADLLAARRFLRGLAEAPSEVRDDVDGVCDEIGRRPIAVMTTEQSCSPALYCAPRPTLVFPLTLWRHLPSDEREAIVRHELAHWHRRDPWRNALARGVGCLLWWNPLTWVFRAAMHRYGEMAADAWAVRRGADRQKLAAGLLATHAWVASRHHAGAIAAVSSRAGRRTARRIRQLFRRRMLGGAVLGAALCACLAGSGSYIAWVIAQTPGGVATQRRIPFGGFVARAIIALEGETRFEDLPKYVHRLRSAPSLKVRREAADDLGNLFERGAVALPDLLRALEHDPSESVRREAVDAMWRIGVPVAPQVRARLRERLKHEKSDRVIRTIEEILDH